MATLKVSILEACNLPVMDRATGLADPYVFVKFDDMQDETDICPHTRNPQWNKDFRFDIPNLESLQEDPLEVRVYDHDVFSRDDIIGSVFVDLNCLLETKSGRPVLATWFPLYDTMSGLRGQINITLKIIFHGGVNPFSPQLPTRGLSGLRQGAHTHQRLAHQEATGVHIFSMARLDPSVYRVEGVFAMVEELLVKADPEQSTLRSIRSSRRTYEARTVQLFKLSGKVRRQLSKKVSEIGCNCVLGYRETFDFENANGIIVRAYGTPCVISGVEKELVSPPMLLDQQELSGYGSALGVPPSGGPGLSMDGVGGQSTTGMSGGGGTSILAYNEKSAAAAAAGSDATSETSSQTTETTSVKIDARHVTMRVRALRDITKLTRSQVDVLTVTQLPVGVLTSIGGTVCARSVKVVSRHRSKPSLLQERDSWWIELREEIKANARVFGCNAVLCYKEETEYVEDVVVMTAIGTAVCVDRSWRAMHLGPQEANLWVAKRHQQNKLCTILHVVNQEEGETNSLPKCGLCRKKYVPEMIILTSELPSEFFVSSESSPKLLEAHAVKKKSDCRGAELAHIISQAIPSLEYTLNRQLMFKARKWQANAVCNFRMSIKVSANLIVATATATCVFVLGLPPPLDPRVEYTCPENVLHDAVVRRFRSSVQALDEVVTQTQRSEQQATALHKSKLAAEAQTTTSPGLQGKSKKEGKSPVKTKTSHHHGTPRGGLPDISLTPTTIAKHSAALAEARQQQQQPPVSPRGSPTLTGSAGHPRHHHHRHRHQQHHHPQRHPLHRHQHRSALLSPSGLALSTSDQLPEALTTPVLAGSSITGDPHRQLEIGAAGSLAVGISAGGDIVANPSGAAGTATGTPLAHSLCVAGSAEQPDGVGPPSSEPLVEIATLPPPASVGAGGQQQQRDDDDSFASVSLVTTSLSSSQTRSSSSYSSSSSSSSSSEEEFVDKVKRTEFIVQIDDPEEAEDMLGLSNTHRLDTVLCSASYFQGDPNKVEALQNVYLQSRYDLEDLEEHAESAVEYITNRIAETKRLLIYRLLQFARRKNRTCVVFSYRSELNFEEEYFYVRLSGVFSSLRDVGDPSVLDLETLARVECDRLVKHKKAYVSALADTSSSSDSDDEESPSAFLDSRAPALRQQLFMAATAPFTLPFVMQRLACNQQQHVAGAGPSGGVHYSGPPTSGASAGAMFPSASSVFVPDEGCSALNPHVPFQPLTTAEFFSPQPSTLLEGQSMTFTPTPSSELIGGGNARTGTGGSSGSSLPFAGRWHSNFFMNPHSSSSEMATPSTGGTTGPMFPPHSITVPRSAVMMAVTSATAATAPTGGVTLGGPSSTASAPNRRRITAQRSTGWRSGSESNG